MIEEQLEQKYHETQIKTAEIQLEIEKTKLAILKNELTKTEYLIEYSMFSAKLKKLKYMKKEREFNNSS